MTKLWAEKNGLLVPHSFGYDAIEEGKKKRKAPRTMTRSEDDELNSAKRKRMIATARDLLRNFSIAGWAIRKHLDYVATFSFQCRTPDQAFNKNIERLLQWWALPANCDVAGRHSLQRLVRLAEQARTVDGDVLLIMLGSGQLQAIESDRIVDPTAANVQTGSGSIANGVRMDEYGRAVEYAVSRRTTGSSAMQFDRWVAAANAILLGYFDRFDQARGVSRLAPAINSFQDVYECNDYALAKAKVSQLFGLVTYRENSDPLGSTTTAQLASGTGSRYEVNFGAGPFHLDLDDGDKAEVLESKTPSTELQQFCDRMVGAALKALDIPFSFFDESFTNYSGARQALLQYEQSVEAKRADLVEALDRITTWKIAQWIAGGLLQLPAGFTRVEDIPWEWVPAGIPWIDPLKEVDADTKAVALGIKSRQRICRERGLDFFDTVDELAQEQEYAEAAGVEITPKEAASAAKAPEEETDRGRRWQGEAGEKKSLAIA